MSTPSQSQRDAVRAFTEANMNASVRIHRGVRGSFDSTTGLHSGLANDSVIYAGPARIRNITGSGVLEIGEDTIDTATSTISIPWGKAVPRRDDLVEVVSDSAADTEPNGQWFRVLDIEAGGLFGEARRMHCVVWRDSSQWSRS